MTEDPISANTTQESLLVDIFEKRKNGKNGIQNDQIPSVKVNSQLKSWYNKKYLGGYRRKISLVEYFNAETQTPTAQEIKSQNVRIIR